MLINFCVFYGKKLITFFYHKKRIAEMSTILQAVTNLMSSKEIENMFQDLDASKESTLLNMKISFYY
jgi:hypothetical protein